MDNLEQKTIDEIQKILNTNIKTGLTNQKASELLIKNGKNELAKNKQTPAILIFLKSLIQPIQIVLFIAAIISVIAPLISSKHFEVKFDDFIDFIVIMGVIILDATLETIQQIKARKSVDALKSLSKPSAILLRDSIVKEIDASELVVGDIVILEAGKYVPADLRLLESSDCMVEESILTGESLPVEKNIKPIKQTNILADKKNICFMSTFITSGRAIGVVIKTGIDTEIGKISKTISENEEQVTPLEKKMNKFSYLISILAIIISFFVFISFIISSNKNNWATYLMISITLAIGVIPESLSAIVSIALSFATKRMAKNNVIVKKLESIETLGSVNVICTDKTGTLTQNKMAIKKLIWNNQIILSDEFIDKTENELAKTLFLKSLVLPNDSITEKDERIGDPTELALVDFAEQLKIDEQEFRRKYPRIFEIPFDSERKLMSTVNILEDDKKFIFTKGALDQILKKCSKIFINNKIVKLTNTYKKEIKKLSTSLSDDALRVLGFGFKQILNDEQQTEEDLIFIGAVGMIDPIRKEALIAIQHAKAAGIKTIMITGDHAITALAIAKDLDLAYTQYEVMSSEKLEQYTDQELESAIDNIKIFARVNPEHKVRIVQALQKKGYIVSMTGDGVNDAPSLAIADIGVAMGVSGTDVAKQAADVILTNDDLNTMMTGVLEGRNVYQKIRRAIVLLLGFNFANVISIVIISLLLKISPLNATNILFVNLVVDSCLAFGIGMSPIDRTLLKNKPQLRNSNILSEIIWPLFKVGLSLSTAQIISFIIGMSVTNLDYYNSLENYNKANNWFLFIQQNSNTLLTNLDDMHDFIVFGRTSMFITSIISPILFTHLIKLTNWKETKKIDWTISKPLICACVIALLISIIAFSIPVLNSKVFGLAGINDTKQYINWNSKNMWILFSSLGCGLIPFIFILITDAIEFYSYHLSNRTWEKRQKLIKQIIDQEQKEQELKKEDKKNQAI
ncbi:cation-translocating P-type ATPase [Mycoplasma capricolum]|uniref:cation-translocating P-type ATPase n=1 Tax=Mycoplasma capricolum TaxID=2095 RepID=UPI003DA3ABB9